MSLQEYWKKIKEKFSEIFKGRTLDTDSQGSTLGKISLDEEGNPIRFPLIHKFFLTLLIILVAVLSFGLGKLSNLSQGEPIKIEYENLEKGQTLSTDSQGLTLGSEAVSASSQGTKYYYSWCGNNISEKNRVSFATALLAEKAGYTLAANCKPR